MRLKLSKLLDDDDLWSTRLGRYSDAEEHMMRRLMSSSPLPGWLSTGRDLRVPGYVSTRPKSPTGAETFSFSHRNVVLKTVRHPKAGRLYCQGSGKGDIRVDRSVGYAGRRGCQYVIGGRLPAGFRKVTPVALSTGMRAGAAGAYQGYIERDGAVEMAGNILLSIGSLHDNPAIRQQFWDDVEEREGPGGRVQSRIIADLPYEMEVGPEGRLQIVASFGAIFDRLGLPWHGVVHVPEKQSDIRNYHLHFVYHARPISFWDSFDTPVFAGRKSSQVKSVHWLKNLRATYASIVNKVMLKVGLSRRWDSRTYAEMGIEKLPSIHLGSAAMGLERRGIVTTRGTLAAKREIVSAMVRVRQRRVDAGLQLWSRISATRDSVLPRMSDTDRMLAAKGELARSIADFAQMWWRHQDVLERKNLVEQRSVTWLSRVEATRTVRDFEQSAFFIASRLARVSRLLKRQISREEHRLRVKLQLLERAITAGRTTLEYERRRANYMRAKGRLQIARLANEKNRPAERAQKKQLADFRSSVQQATIRVRQEEKRLLDRLDENIAISDPVQVISQYRQFGMKSVPIELQELFFPYEISVIGLKKAERFLKQFEKKSEPSQKKSDEKKLNLNIAEQKFEDSAMALKDDWRRFLADTGIDVRKNPEGIKRKT